MPAQLLSYILDWRNFHDYLKADFIRLAVGFNEASYQCDAESWSGLAQSFRNLSNDVEYIVDHIKGGSPTMDVVMQNTMYWINANWPEGAEEYELTWQKIIEAWSANHFEGRVATIAWIDKMRQLIWDEPFNVRWAADPILLGE